MLCSAKSSLNSHNIDLLSWYVCPGLRSPIRGLDGLVALCVFAHQTCVFPRQRLQCSFRTRLSLQYAEGSLSSPASAFSTNLPALAVSDGSLGLEQQDRNMSQVEVDEVFRLCCSVSSRARSQLQPFSPCVTKLPKFLPTMQCQVAPFLWSN